MYADIFRGILIPFLGTALGAACVFFMKRTLSTGIQRALTGFAAGIMTAASVWSLLLPAIERAEAAGYFPGWLPPAAGMLAGTVFLAALDALAQRLMGRGLSPLRRRNVLLMTAITLHNIPEGMAVGLSFALAAQHGGDAALYTAAMALAIGIGIQNFPEGAAISLPLRQEGMGRFKAFLCGSLSGVVEPIFGVLAVLVAGGIAPVMPWLLAFAAGAMMYVVVEELIPEAHLGEHSNVGTLGVMAGFLVMMVLDVALG